MNRNISKGGEHCSVNCLRIIHNCADHLLNEFFVVVVEEGGIVCVLGVLDLHAILWFDVWVRLILGFIGGDMMESF